MRFLRLNTTDPYWNLAVEEYLFLHAEDDVFLLWQNRPTVVIGKNQNAYTEVKLDYIRENGICLARRITGGGAVYHDLGNLNYSFLSVRGEHTGLDFASFVRPILGVLSSLGVAASLSGRNDLEIEGRKFSGNAQHACGGRVLHHGTLLFDSELDVLERVLNVDREKLAGRAISSVRARVTNLKPFLPRLTSVADFADQIATYVQKELDAKPMILPQDAQIQALYERNRSKEWLYPERDLLSQYSVVKTQRGAFGGIKLCLRMQNDIIREAKIEGDFFGTRPIAELETALCNQSREDAAHTVLQLNVGEYLFGMTPQELFQLLMDD